MQTRSNRTLLVITVVVLTAMVLSSRNNLAKRRAVSLPQETENVQLEARIANPPDGKIVVVTGGKVVCLDRISKAILWESSGLRGAYSIAALSTGGYLVGEGKSLAQIDQDGRFVSRASASLKFTTDVKSLADGRMLVSDGEAGTVAEMDWSGNIGWSVRGLHFPSEAVRLESGDTLVADGTAELKEFDSKGRLVSATRLRRWAASVQKMSGGHMLVGERHLVELLDTAVHAIWSQTIASRITGVEQLPSGEYLLSEPDAGRIVILDVMGNVDWKVTGLVYPWRAIYMQ